MDGVDVADDAPPEPTTIGGESPSQLRWGTWALFTIAGCWLVSMIAHHHHGVDWASPGRFTWALSMLFAVVVSARGLLQGRPVSLPHATTAAAVLLTGIAVHRLSLELLGDGLTASAGVVLTRPTSSRAEPWSLPRVWALIQNTRDDPLAPFAMLSTKSYFFNARATAAIAYRSRFGYAVVSGDPIGDAEQFPDLIDAFASMCRRRGWRVIVLGCAEHRVQLWLNRCSGRQGLRAISIGRDVVIDVRSFSTAGRTFRNLRQAVQRTRNAGITTEVVSEQGLDNALSGELAALMHASHRGSHTDRGFSMILDHALEGRYPGIKLIVARDRGGRVQGFHRYTVAGGGSDVSLDLPWRRPGAPNGIDERLAVDMIDYCRKSGGQRLSLAFAPFPELFDAAHRSPIDNTYYRLVHLGDPLIRLESLYRYLRKFHALGRRRYVLLSVRDIPAAFVILMSLEFVPRPRIRRANLPGTTRQG